MTWSLVEREAEISALEEWFAESLGGQGRVVIVNGGVGLGKTALLQLFSRQVNATDAVQLSAAASAAEQDLPLGVVSQLFASDELRRYERVLRGQVGTEAYEILCRALLSVAEDSPVLIQVDDVHFSDMQSLRFLNYLVRRIDSARVFAILSGRAQVSSADPRSYAEIISRPNVRTLWLRPLSEAGCAKMLLEQLVPDQDIKEFAASCFKVTGGNPLLVRGLIVDSAAASTQLVPGEAFRRAVLTALHRFEPAVLRFAEARAVLGNNVAAGEVAELAGGDETSNAQAAAELELAGLLEAGRFRHHNVPAMILGRLSPAERAGLHGKAARLLREGRATLEELARHLIAADDASARWASSVLLQAGEAALAGGDAERARSYLRLAYRGSSTEWQREIIKRALFRAEWRVNPAMAALRVPERPVEPEEGAAADLNNIMLLNSLLLCDSSAAEDAVGKPRQIGREPGWAVRSPGFRLLLGCIFPDFLNSVKRPADEVALSAADVDAHPAMSLYQQAAHVLADVLAQGDLSDANRSRAINVLQGWQLDDRTIIAMVTALSALVFADESHLAAQWCCSLLGKTKNVPTWHAMISGVSAMANLQHGDLRSADEHATVALGQFPAHGYGMWLGGLLASSILAKTAMGGHDNAAALIRMPVPPGMFGTLYGVRYLHARGRYYLAAGSLQAALADLQSCGQMITRWGIRLDASIPWRIDTAQVLLKMGRVASARELVDQEVARWTPSSPRQWGLAIKALAQFDPPGQRVALLREAVEALRESSARSELAMAMAELGAALRSAGDHEQGLRTGRKALQLARICGADGPVERLLADARLLPAVGRPNGDVLSGAEWRVATMAATGHSNREIADRLHITVSTVEQHLTRVYRKLQVNRREDLAQHVRNADLDGSDFVLT